MKDSPFHFGFGTLTFGAVSVISVVVSKLMHVFTAFSVVFIVVACFGIIIGMLFKGGKRIALLVISVLLLIATFFLQRNISTYATNSERVSDATETLVDFYFEHIKHPDEDFKWISEENLFNNKIACFLIPSEDLDEFCDYVFDPNAVIKDDPDEKRIGIYPLHLTQRKEKVKTKYLMALVYTPHLYRGREFSGAIQVPTSAFHVLKGMIKKSELNWLEAKGLLERARSENNAAASYYLSRMCRSGLGDEPDFKQADILLKEAAERGSRRARYEWGLDVLKDTNVAMFDLEKSMAEELLVKASCLKETIGSVTAAELSRKSILCLNDFYRSCGKENGSKKYFYKAFLLTKRGNRAFTDTEVKYVAYLDNCVSLKRYKKALDIIEEGKKEKQPYCYLVHADMYSKGKGVEVDYEKAEKLLRFAADSLNCYLAYRELAELFRESGKEGVEFWERLYDIKFSNTIE